MHPTHCLICAQVPSLLEENIAEAAEARKRGRRARALPFATELPTGATYYVLKRRPELAETPAGKIVASEQEASQGPHDAEAFVRSLGEAAPGRLTSIAVWKSTSASGAPDNSSLSHFSAMTLPCWLRRAVRNRHRHAVEQASCRWRGGRRGDSGRTRRKILISTQFSTARIKAAGPSSALSRRPERKSGNASS